MVSPFNVFPPYWGAARRIYSLAVNLSRRRVVHLMCNAFPKEVSQDSVRQALELGGDLSIEMLGFDGRPSQLFNPRLSMAVLRRLRSDRFSALFGHFLWSASICMPVSIIRGIPFFLDLHNVESDRLPELRGMKPSLGVFLRSYEKLACTAASRVFCVSEPDRERLIHGVGIDKNKIELVPHGVEVFEREETVAQSVREELCLSRDDPIVLFFGPADYLPNREAVEVLCTSVAPRVFSRHPSAKMLIIGQGWDRSVSTDRIRFIGYRSDLDRFVRAADVVAAPIYRGGGAQLKVLESLAYGTPVVTTPFVARRFAKTVVEKALIVARDTVELADQISNQLTDRTVAFSAEEVRRKMSWRAVSRKVDDALISLGC